MFIELWLVVAVSFAFIFAAAMIIWLLVLCVAEYNSPEARKEHFQLWFMSLLALPAIWVWPVTLVAGVVWGVYKGYGYAFPNGVMAEKENLINLIKE